MKERTIRSVLRKLHVAVVSAVVFATAWCTQPERGPSKTEVVQDLLITAAAADATSPVTLDGDSLTYSPLLRLKLGVPLWNYATGGATSATVLGRAPGERSSDIMILMIGTNESNGQGLNQQNWLQVVSILSAKHKKFYCVSILPMTESVFPGRNAIAIQNNVFIKANCPGEYVDIRDLFLDDRLRFDGVHMGSEGYDIMAREYGTIIARATQELRYGK